MSARSRRGTRCSMSCSTPFGSGRGARESPRIAILDWREVPTYSEFLLFRDYFRSQGLDVRDRGPARGGISSRQALARAICTSR